MTKQTLYHGRAEMDPFEPQIGTYLTPNENTAVAYATMDGAAEAARVVESMEFSDGESWVCVLSPLGSCNGTYLHAWLAETEPYDEVVPISACPEHGRVDDGEDDDDDDWDEDGWGEA